MKALQFEWVVIVGVCAAFSVSLHGAALLCAKMAFVLLTTDAVRSLFRWLRLPCDFRFTALWATAVGGALHRLFSAFSPTDIPLLASPILFLVLSFLCGTVRLETVSAKHLWKAAFAVLLIGCLRELIGAASVGGYPFSAITPLTTFSTNGLVPEIGGMLLAAFLLWVLSFGGSYPSFERNEAAHAALVTVVTTTAHLLLSVRFTPNVIRWFFGYAVFTAVILVLLSCKTTALWAFIPPLVPFLLPTVDGWVQWTFPLICGIAVFVLWRTVEAVFDRLSLAVLPRRFDGVPAFLTVAAIGVAAVRTLL